MSTNINRNSTKLSKMLCFVCYAQMLASIYPLSLPWVELSPSTDGDDDLKGGSVDPAIDGAAMCSHAGCALNNCWRSLYHRERPEGHLLGARSAQLAQL